MKTLQFEAVKYKLVENTDTTFRLSLDIHPDDVVSSGLIGVKRNTRFMVVMAPIDDDEQPVPEYKPPVGHTTLQERVHILAKQPLFWKFLTDKWNLFENGITNMEECLKIVRDYLVVDSMKNLTAEKAAKGNTLLAEYAKWASRPTGANEN